MPPPSAALTADRVSRSDTAVDPDELQAAWRAARIDLLAERNAQGYWVGELSSSPLSTATAISALAVAERHATSLEDADDEASENWHTAYRADLSELIVTSVRWLAEQQNPDGGWGDTDRSSSNLATTLLALSAFRMTGVPAKYADLEPRAEQYIRSQGGAIAGLKKRYGRDKTFAAPILTNCALAGVVGWKQVPTLPMELAAAPPAWFRWLRMPVVSYAIPALVAIGLAKFHHRKPLNPIARWVRSMVTDRCLRRVAKMQPDSGGFLEATPLTSFVVMSLASAGRADHPIVRRGVEFLLASVRPDGSWPIDTNLATWNTTLALNALRKGLPGPSGFSAAPAVGDSVAEPGGAAGEDPSLSWLLACQHNERHPFTDADPGGWAWTNLSGGVPDADDTSGALLALHGYWSDAPSERRAPLAKSAAAGVRWLLDLQNRDGGWPTFCRGWGKLPFDRSATDLTAHALRALDAWRRGLPEDDGAEPSTAERIDKAISDGLRFLADRQSADGSWDPLWFGNETRPGEANPVFGTSRVLLALAEVDGLDSPMAARGLQWLVGQQHVGGGWGSCPLTPVSEGQTPPCSVEETAVATEALVRFEAASTSVRHAADAGLKWLIRAVDQGKLRQPAPIGLYFAKLWYHERLYPKSFALSALGSAVATRIACQRHWEDDRQDGDSFTTVIAPA